MPRRASSSSDSGRESNDWLFASFAASFWLLAIGYTVLGLVHLADETRPYVFMLRFSAFAVIIIGVLVKSRS